MNQPPYGMTALAGGGLVSMAPKNIFKNWVMYVICKYKSSTRLYLNLSEENEKQREIKEIVDPQIGISSPKRNFPKVSLEGVRQVLKG